MNERVMQIINKLNPKLVILDIDGTLKDLCKEHTNSLVATLQHFNVSELRKNVVLALNRLAMYVVKTGFVSTNHSKQDFLLKIYSIICGGKFADFYEYYFECYAREVCLFDGVYELLAELNLQREVHFATINKQNYNLESCGILQERIIYTDGTFKVATYNSILKNACVAKEDVIVVGDNLLDDYFSSKQLGVKCILVNNYKNRLKGWVCKFANGKYLK